MSSKSTCSICHIIVDVRKEGKKIAISMGEDQEHYALVYPSNNNDIGKLSISVYARFSP